ncbi:MAG: Na+-transporting NADH:ubiquinone oxidoreductase subunit D [Candidatus Omnitrophota bacterium]|nr:MAG: Na+-transporting NADH:ubiquinone oxidoreductase subunit D [Candidatus Omnitrophota bacterium]
MKNDQKICLTVNCAPHIHTQESVAKIMWTVFFCLIPAGIVSIYIFGWACLWIMLTAVLSAGFTEYLSCVLQKKKSTLADGSAFLTGLLLAYNLPPHSPLWMVFLGSFVAILFGKVLFGGLGSNIFNPALVGRVFLVVSFPALMTHWPKPFSVDAVTAPTPLAIFKDGFSGTNVLADLSVNSYSYLDLFLGFRGGCIGEVCIIALLSGALYLLVKGYISWHIPVSFIGTVAIFSWIFAGGTFFRGDFIFHLLCGGLILGAFFMATDYVTGPMTKKGKLIFGVGCGLITSVIRLWGGYPEGVSFSILIMNAAAPLIDRFTMPKVFGKLK